MNKKRKWLLGGLVSLCLGGLVYSTNTDLWSVQGLGSGTFYNKDVARVDVNGNLRLYTGSIFLGDIGVAPTATLAASLSSYPSTLPGYQGLKVSFFNNSGAATANGSVLTAATTVSTAAYCTTTTAVATTTVVGIADGVYANQTVGWMTVSGYALVQTTGTVTIGAVIVSSGTAGGGGGNGGWAGTTTGTQVVGTGIGKALQSGTAAGGTTLCLINLQ